MTDRPPDIGDLEQRLATGLHVITAHARRRPWQAWGVRRVLENHTQERKHDAQGRSG
jgi:hypothetical protein